MGEVASVAYSKLFSMEILHTFYTSGISKRDFAVVPTMDTMQVMKDSNIMFRATDEASVLFYKTTGNAGASFINFSNLRLIFSLNLLNINEFFNFTDLGTYSAGKVLYFTNLNAVTNTNLTLTVLDGLRPAIFNYEFPQTATAGTDTGHIKITNQTGADVTPLTPDPDTIKPDNQNRFFYPIDFSKLPKGLYNFETWVNAGSHVTKKIYIDGDLAKQGVMGIIDISVLNANSGSFPPSPNERLYKMSFTRRLTQWRYYVGLKSGNVVPGDTISISVSTQSPYPSAVFSRITPDVTINGVVTAIFESDLSTIPFFEEPWKGLNILKGATVVLPNIQGPSLGVVSGAAGISEMYVFI